MLVIFASLVGILLYLFVRNSENTPEYDSPTELITQPFNFDTSVRIDIPDSLVGEINAVRSLSVYKISDETHLSNVSSFISKVGLESWKMENFGGIYYLWTDNNEETSYYLIDYDLGQDKVFIRLPDPIQISSEISIPSVGDESTLFLESFVKEYLDRDVKYTNQKISRNGGTTTIEANRLIGDKKTMLSGLSEFTDYIKITENGELLEAQVYLFELEEIGYSVGMIQPELMQRLLNRSDFPKDIHRMLPIGWSSDSSDDLFLGDVHKEVLDASEQAIDNCTVEDIQIVYYYSSRNITKYISPTFRMYCVGEVTIDGSRYDVPLVVYANALDPEFVFVPNWVK